MLFLFLILFVQSASFSGFLCSVCEDVPDFDKVFFNHIHRLITKLSLCILVFVEVLTPGTAICQLID